MSIIQYSQSQSHFIWNGKIYGISPSTYSGRLPWKNKSAGQCVKNYGPIPRGFYKIGAPTELKRNTLGPFVLPLTPDGAAMCGRDHFYIHGDSVSHPGQASDGCIVTTRTIREMINKNKITELEVVL
jgi:hypothetical protein